MLVIVTCKRLHFYLKKLIPPVQKLIINSSGHDMVRCFFIAVMSTCLLTTALVVCACTVMADNGNLVIQVFRLNSEFVGCIIAPHFYRAVSGSYRINNIAGGKFSSQVK